MTSCAVRPELAIVFVLPGMAGITILRRSFENSIYMTGGTLNVCVRACQRKSRSVVIEIHIAPARRLVAGVTYSPKLTIMVVILGVAGKAVLRRPFEHPIDMTRRTSDGRMRTHQREGRDTMVKVHVAPTRRLMAGFAGCPILTVVAVILGMTGEAVLRRAPEDSIGMAGFTGLRSVRTDQRKTGAVMVEDNIAPAGGRMAGSAFFSERSVMHIVFGVAGKTTRPNRRENTVHMALGTIRLGMLADQRKASAGMVKVCHLPIIRGVTLIALFAKFTLVRVLIAMAGETILRRPFEYIIYMAFNTVGLGMFASQFKC